MSEQKMEALTRTYVVPLGVVTETPAYRRSKKAITIIREFATRHMKATEVKINPDVNEHIWSRGIKHPPRRVTLEMERDEEGVVTIKLPPKPEQE